MNALNFPEDFATPALVGPLVIMSRRLYSNAACLDADPKLFDTTIPGTADAIQALAHCKTCPVIAECLAVLKPESTEFDGVAGNQVWRRGSIQQRNSDQLF
jgi:hypothetical protein